MRILLAGEWRARIHEKGLSEALRRAGCEVYEFAWHKYFCGMGVGGNINHLKDVFLRAQAKLVYGPVIHKINADFIKTAAEVMPDVVFIYRGILIGLETLQKVKARAKSTVILGYNNDNPFSPAYNSLMWRRHVRSIAGYDMVFAYRPENIAQYKNAGARRVSILPPWYLPEEVFPIQDLPANGDKKKYACDVAFIGHYEPDGRAEILEYVARAGVSLKLCGPEWKKYITRYPCLQKCFCGEIPRDTEYNKAINGAKIGLCFFSKLNRDVYTRRCFEIPAAGTFLLSENSREMREFFRPGIEADYFANRQELLDKILFYLSDDVLRQKVALAGLRRVRQDGHDVYSRAQYIMQSINGFKSGKL